MEIFDLEFSRQLESAINGTLLKTDTTINNKVGAIFNRNRREVIENAAGNYAQYRTIWDDAFASMTSKRPQSPIFPFGANPASFLQFAAIAEVEIESFQADLNTIESIRRQNDQVLGEEGKRALSLLISDARVTLGSFSGRVFRNPDAFLGFSNSFIPLRTIASHAQERQLSSETISLLDTIVRNLDATIPNGQLASPPSEVLGCFLADRSSPLPEFPQATLIMQNTKAVIQRYAERYLVELFGNGGEKTGILNPSQSPTLARLLCGYLANFPFPEEATRYLVDHIMPSGQPTYKDALFQQVMEQVEINKPFVDESLFSETDDLPMRVAKQIDARLKKPERQRSHQAAIPPLPRKVFPAILSGQPERSDAHNRVRQADPEMNISFGQEDIPSDLQVHIREAAFRYARNFGNLSGDQKLDDQTNPDGILIRGDGWNAYVFIEVNANGQVQEVRVNNVVRFGK